MERAARRPLSPAAAAVAVALARAEMAPQVVRRLRLLGSPVEPRPQIRARARAVAVAALASLTLVAMVARDLRGGFVFRSRLPRASLASMSAPKPTTDDDLIAYLLSGGNGTEPLTNRQVLAVLRFLLSTTRELRAVSQTMTTEVSRLALAVNNIEDAAEVTGQHQLNESRARRRRWEKRGWDVAKILIALSLGFAARHIFWK